MNSITTWTAAAALALSPLALATTADAAPTSVSTRAAAWTVTARINRTVAIGKETTLKVRGRVKPKAVGQKVVLQQRVGTKKTWNATGSSKIKADGTYVLKDTPSTPGSRQYRVLKPGSDGIAKAFSRTLDVEVYSWQKLTNRTPVATNVNVPIGVTIATGYYTRSVATDVSGMPATIEYTLGRKCLELRATYALTDQSPTGASGAITVSADGAVLAAHPLAIGTIVADESLDLTDVFRLKFDLSTSATPAAIAAIGMPEVLCTR